MKLKLLLTCLLGALGMTTSTVWATIYPLPYNGARIIGQVQTATTHRGDTLSSIGRRFNMGFYELVEANRSIARFDPLPSNSPIVIPSQYILPDLPQEGIVINLTEMRLYYFLPSRRAVMTVPIGIGRVSWETPTGFMRIVEKRANPTWVVPKSIRQAREAEGVILPVSVPPGPENPLGRYAMRLSKREYLIHGTNRPDGIGRRITSGCIRLFPEDMKELFNQVTKGTHVRIIGKAYKLAWFKRAFYLEVHEPLPEHHPGNLVLAITSLIKKEHPNHPHASIDWDKVMAVIQQQDGIPHRISY